MDSTFYLPSSYSGLKPAMDSTVSRMKSQLGNMAKHDKKERKMIKKATAARMARQRRIRSLRDGMRQSLEANPNHDGKPRHYIVHVDDMEGKVDPAVAKMVENRNMIFGRFGKEGGGIVLDGMAIMPGNVRYNSAGQSYSFNQPKPKSINRVIKDGRKPTTKALVTSHDENEDLPPVSGFIQFAMDEPTGFLTVGDHTVPVRLANAPVLSFNAEVASIESLKLDSINGVSGFDPESDAWKNAAWDDDVVFQERTLYSRHPDTGDIIVDIENYFIDKAGGGEVRWELTKQAEELHASNLYDVTVVPSADGGWAEQTELADPIGYVLYCPDPPTERADRDVQSVFPFTSVLHFDPFGLTFDGYYTVPESNDFQGNFLVYAMRGDFEGIFAPSSLAAHARMVQGAAAPRLQARAGTPSARATTSNLSVSALLGMTTLVDDVSNDFGHRDVVFDQAMADFHDIILYYMDDDLRRTFVQESPINLSGPVKQIADDSNDNSEFYQALQAPLIISVLASTTLDDTDKLNYLRAEKIMKDMPKDSPVFKRHMSKLYNMRYKEKFGEIDDYLADGLFRSDSEYDIVINELQNVLQLQLPRIEVLYQSDEIGLYQERVEEMQQRITDLGDLAKRKKTFWALKLYQNIMTVTLPSWHRNNTLLAHGANLKQIKAINCVFGMLEDEATQRSELSFGQSFNEAIELWQLTAQLPTYVDLLGNIDTIDTYMKNVLGEWLNAVHTPDDSEDFRVYTEDITLLHQQEALRRGLISLFAMAQQTATVGVGLLGFQLAQAQLANVSGPLIAKFGASPRILAAFSGHLTIALFVYLIVAGGVDFKNLSPVQKGTVIGAGAVMAIFGLNSLKNSFVALPNAARSAREFFRTNVLRERSIRLADIGRPVELSKAEANTFRNFRDHPKLNQLAGPQTGKGAAPSQAGKSKQIWARFGTSRLWMGVFLIMNVAALALAIFFLTKSEEPLEIAGNTFFLLSSVAALLGFAFTAVSTSSMAVGMSGSLAMTGAFMSFASLLFLAVGIILLFVFIFTAPDIETPVQKFIREYAKPQGLEMDPGLMTIDYLLDLTANSKAAETLGASIRNTNTSFSHRYLAIGDVLYHTPEGADPDVPPPAPELVPASSLTLSDKDIWTVTTDHAGKTYFSTKRYVQPQGLVGDNSQDLNQWEDQLWFLGTTSNNKVVLKQLPGRDQDNYNEELETVQWDVEVKNAPQKQEHTYDDPEGNEQTAYSLKVANCVIRKNSRVLALKVETGGSGFELLASSSQQWRIELQPKFPSGFEYLVDPWTLLTDDENLINPRIFIPFFSTSRQGFTWSINPPLPSKLELVKELGFDEGFIRMKKDEKIEDEDAQDPTEYIVTCQLNENGKTYKTEGKLTIAIKTREQARQEILDAVIPED